MWTFLNSSFAIWFLTSVVVAGITAAYTHFRKKQDDQARTAAIRRRLNIEIGNRIAEGAIALRLDRTRIARGRTYYSGSIYNEALAYLDNRVRDGKRKVDFSVYPAYRSRGFRSLVFELSAVVAPAELSDLRQANSTYDLLESRADQACLAEAGGVAPEMNKTEAAVTESAALLEALRTYAPWKSPL